MRGFLVVVRPFVREPTPGRVVNVVAPLVVMTEPPIVPTTTKFNNRSVVGELLKQQQQLVAQQPPPQHPKLSSSFFAGDHKAEECGGRGEARPKQLVPRHPLGSDGSSDNSSTSSSEGSSPSSSCSASDNESLRGSPPPPQVIINAHLANTDIKMQIYSLCSLSVWLAGWLSTRVG
jgi:hypothetical protein